MNAGIILKDMLIMVKITTTKVKGLIMGALNFVCYLLWHVHFTIEQGREPDTFKFCVLGLVFVLHAQLCIVNPDCLPRKIFYTTSNESWDEIDSLKSA